jgi:hypothetical protein
VQAAIGGRFTLGVDDAAHDRLALSGSGSGDRFENPVRIATQPIYIQRHQRVDPRVSDDLGDGPYANSAIRPDGHNERVLGPPSGLCHDKASGCAGIGRQGR